ncbi:Haloacid dehalogenase domain protein hydrolase [Catenulispora acidiphila DSM 44928]|uniref:Haloacid dehalogenase domain protein hydrolase n=1 Tax=Catenulispora acidiphila (strain DSM 44928 / JCM 14897 / NBRC 102108 / NRRL B-24433 / ID139908) TaxID=479433 RepID=C7Q420_CATAD|nr:HAD hydrolase-like protein [Catenulispora acidiphila]ACU77778.1 Haloacid dehalogenase domain protein hydrolase [Catenulispora acidiphila DSM 44928]
MPLIVLWDIDHTLIDNAGVSKEIYASAFKALAGHPPAHPARTDGRTDRLIISDMFADHHLPVPAWDLAEAALEQAGTCHEQELKARGRVLPGVRSVLKEAYEDPAIVSSVLTGNIAANALVKLRPFGLDRYLDLAVGAYGADSDRRADLVVMARERIGRAYPWADRASTIVVGDTPRDVEAALTAGAQVIAVASGVHSAELLHAAGATVVLNDLRELRGHLHAI